MRKKGEKNKSGQQTKRKLACRTRERERERKDERRSILLVKRRAQDDVVWGRGEDGGYRRNVAYVDVRKVL